MLLCWTHTNFKGADAILSQRANANKDTTESGGHPYSSELIAPPVFTRNQDGCEAFGGLQDRVWILKSAFVAGASNDLHRNTARILWIYFTLVANLGAKGDCREFWRPYQSQVWYPSVHVTLSELEQRCLMFCLMLRQSVGKWRVGLSLCCV